MVLPLTETVRITIPLFTLYKIIVQTRLRIGKVLLIAPPPMALGEWVPNQQLIDDSHTFARYCETLARRRGIAFADAGRWNISLAHDGVHFTEQSHRAFAEVLLEILR